MVASLPVPAASLFKIPESPRLTLLASPTRRADTAARSAATGATRTSPSNSSSTVTHPSGNSSPRRGPKPFSRSPR